MCGCLSETPRIAFSDGGMVGDIGLFEALVSLLSDFVHLKLHVDVLVLLLYSHTYHPPDDTRHTVFILLQ